MVFWIIALVVLLAFGPAAFVAFVVVTFLGAAILGLLWGFLANIGACNAPGSRRH